MKQERERRGAAVVDRWVIACDTDAGAVDILIRREQVLQQAVQGDFTDDWARLFTVRAGKIVCAAKRGDAVAQLTRETLRLRLASRGQADEPGDDGEDVLDAMRQFAA